MTTKATVDALPFVRAILTYQGWTAVCPHCRRRHKTNVRDVPSLLPAIVEARCGQGSYLLFRPLRRADLNRASLANH